MIKGMVRKIDELGRITLPMGYRKELSIETGDKIDMFLDGMSIRLETYKSNTKGIVRKLDSLGRLTLPMEYRKMLRINIGDPIDMYLEGNVICVKLVKLQCVFCESTNEDKLVEMNGVHVCPKCIAALRQEVMKG